MLLTYLTADARIARSHGVTAEFQRHNPCPATGERSGGCKGYVIDHVFGGADDPSKMKWQTISDAKAKDKWARKEFGK